jgi:type IV pilus assembly protein PilC
MMASAIRQQIQDQISNETEENNTKNAQKRSGSSFFRNTASSQEVSTFFRSFSVLMKSGYTVNRALSVLSQTVSNKDLAKTLGEISNKIEAGSSLSKSVADYPWYFSPVSIGVFKAAEETARLSEALEFLADNADLNLEIREQVKEAVSYPIFVSMVSFALICGIMYFVVPQFAVYISEAGVEVNGFSSVVFAISDFIRLPFIAPVSILAVMLVAQGIYSWSKRYPLAFYRTIARIPLIGKVMLKGSLVRFVSMFHMMNMNGVPAAKALKMAEGTVANAVLQKAVKEMVQSVEQGRPMTAPLKKYSFPVQFVDMLSLGEQTGQFDQILPNLTKSMTTDMSRTTARITMASEPIMLIILGTVVMSIMLSFFIPYFQVISAMSI